jgi:hypothetical protein
MEIVQQLLEILKYTLPAVIVFLTAYFLLTRYMQTVAAERAFEFKLKRDKDILLLRLQAYERMALFLERVNFGSVIGRVQEANLTSADIQYAIKESIRIEFEHNLSQQIYISSNAWRLIVSSKDEMIKTVALIGQQVDSTASAQVFINTLTSAIANTNAPLPTEQALEFLKAECRELF